MRRQPPNHRSDGHTLPISRPTPKVMAAAARPKTTWRPPDNRTLRPVITVIAAPIRKRAITLRITLATRALVPPPKKYGNTGTIADREEHERGDRRHPCRAAQL